MSTKTLQLVAKALGLTEKKDPRKDPGVSGRGHTPDQKQDPSKTQNPFKHKTTLGPSNIHKHATRAGKGGKKVPEKTRTVHKRGDWKCKKKESGVRGVSIYRCHGRSAKHKGEARDIRVNNAYRVAHNRARRRAEKLQKKRQGPGEQD